MYLLEIRTNERYDNIDKNDFNLGGLYGA
ncbi:hypothetical protein PD665_11880 [Staphylococcus aureus]|nr:hypothetical protein [Staphylococcus aureus]MCQ1392365.1 hypothetical protein [Staphylococcus aureus]MCS4679364.1 hypothetical protein [Staphylococcus aureus]MCS4694815.1 hypothetical protein [Staphylococcus aureus]MCZ4106022.1 hypothetical protein [Staphylococcus aureus]MDI5774739.1 hypothetical protein [Staphylococcus aureus]